MKSKRNTRGYVLLEALVALLVFSLGLLGMLGFQAAATKVSSDSRFRTEAAMLADELVAKMSVADMATVESDYDSGGSAPKFAAWLNDRVKGASGLPNATASCIVDAASTTTSKLVTVTIQWTMPDGTGDGRRTEQRGTYVTRALLF